MCVMPSQTASRATRARREKAQRQLLHGAPIDYAAWEARVAAGEA